MTIYGATIKPDLLPWSSLRPRAHRELIQANVPNASASLIWCDRDRETGNWVIDIEAAPVHPGLLLNGIYVKAYSALDLVTAHHAGYHELVPDGGPKSLYRLSYSRNLGGSFGTLTLDSPDDRIPGWAYELVEAAYMLGKPHAEISPAQMSLASASRDLVVRTR